MHSRNNFHASLIVGAFLLCALLSGCATPGPTVISHPDPTVDFARYRSYRMLQPASLVPDRNPVITPILVHQLQEEAGTAFGAKRMVKSANPYSDVLILVHGGLQDTREAKDWGLTYGRFGRELVDEQERDPNRDRRLFVDVFDATTRQLIWRGSAVAPAGESPGATSLQTTVHSIVARYPH